MVMRLSTIMSVGGLLRTSCGSTWTIDGTRVSVIYNVPFMCWCSHLSYEAVVAKMMGLGNPAGFCTHTQLGSGMGWAIRPKATRGDLCGFHHPIIMSHFLVIMYKLCNIQASK